MTLFKSRRRIENRDLLLKPKLFSIIKHRDTELTKKSVAKDILAGTIVAVVALPLSIALAIASGVTPEKGLITAIIAGFFISFLGGSRVQIGGPTGAFVVIISGIVAEFGVQGLTVATIMAGIFLILFGIMRLGSIIKFIPYPTTTGFTSGIAVVLFSTQVKDFLGLKIENVPAGFLEKWHVYAINLSSLNTATAVVGLASLLVIILWPKISKVVPGSLVALIMATVVVKAFRLPVETIGSRFGGISNTFTLINPADFNLSFAAIQQLIIPALTIAFLAGVESLLSAVVADGIIGKKHNSNMELIAQGVANIACSFFGGIPATGAIARTAANVKNGGRTPIAGIVHAVVLLLIMLVLMPLAKLIPMPALSAILIIVAYNMSEWRAFKGLFKSTKSDITVLLTTFLLTVFFDLVVAIAVSMVIAMFLFVKRMSESTSIANTSNEYKAVYDADNDDNEESDYAYANDLHEHLGSKILLYEINGPLFFGAAAVIVDVMNEINSKARVLILRMKNVPNIDATAFSSLKTIEKSCRERHILIIFAEVNEQPMKLLTSTGFAAKLGEKRFFDSTQNAISAANEIINSKTALHI